MGRTTGSGVRKGTGEGESEEFPHGGERYGWWELPEGLWAPQFKPPGCGGPEMRLRDERRGLRGSVSGSPAFTMA